MALPTGRFVDIADVENCISAELLRRLTDDDNTGEPRPETVQQLIDDNESVVIGAAVRNYPNASLPTTPAAARTTEGGRLLRRITLDFIKGHAYSRHPEVARSDGEAVLDRAQSLLKMLSEAKLVLEGLTAAPANVGGEVIPDRPDVEEPVSFWSGPCGTGIF